jgi:hypothetical protein
MAQKSDQEALKTLKKQLNCYLDSEKGIIFENPMTEPRDGTFNSIEDLLPFAAIIGLYPEHPSVEMALDFLKSKERPDGMIISGNDITTEGCYTIAYPLAVLAVTRNNRDLAQTALNQLLFRTRFLANDHTIFQRAIAIVSNWQNKEGLWHSFIERSKTGIDTSASAGIATAIGWGVRLGLLDQAMLKKARKAHSSIMDYLTPDGFLTHVSQINRGGETLQASGYRVISQFGMGLLAQLGTII